MMHGQCVELPRGSWAPPWAARVWPPLLFGPGCVIGPTGGGHVDGSFTSLHCEVLALRKMGAFSITEVNFLRLLKACEMGLLKHDSSESMSRTTAARYKQYVRTLTSYAEELQRIAEADSEEPEDVSSGHVSRQMSHCSLSPDEMVQHQQKVLLIQEALQRVVLSLDTCADPGTVSNMQARTDKSALTTVRVPPSFSCTCQAYISVHPPTRPSAYARTPRTESAWYCNARWLAHTANVCRFRAEA